MSEPTDELVYDLAATLASMRAAEESIRFDLFSFLSTGEASQIVHLAPIIPFESDVILRDPSLRP